MERLGLLSVDPDKEERLQAKLAGLFDEEGSERHERTLELSHADALAAARMGPSAWHLDPASWRAACRSCPSRSRSRPRSTWTAGSADVYEAAARGEAHGGAVGAHDEVDAHLAGLPGPEAQGEAPAAVRVSAPGCWWS